MKRLYVSITIKYPDNQLVRYMTPEHPGFKELERDPLMLICNEIRDKHGVAECVWRENDITLVTAWPLESIVSSTYLEEE